MRAGRIMVATLGLLALATSAHAECAWVLWTQTKGPQWTERTPGAGFANGIKSTYTNWEATTAVSTDDECVRLLAETLQRRAGYQFRGGH